METKERVYKGNPKHGGRRTPEYSVWTGIKTRCFNPNCESYPDYGGRGISMCKAWADDFSVFLADVGQRPTNKHTLERVDVNKGYEPGNVRWATRIEQGRNTRANRQITYNGETKPLVSWADELLIPANVLLKRLNRGHSFEAAVAEGYEPTRRARVALEAVKSIPTEALEAGVIGELKTALEECANHAACLADLGNIGPDVLRIATAALAKMEGK